MIEVETCNIEGIGAQVAYKDETVGIAIVEQEAFGVRQIFVESEKEMFGLKAVISENKSMLLTLNEPVFSAVQFSLRPNKKPPDAERIRRLCFYLATTRLS